MKIGLHRIVALVGALVICAPAGAQTASKRNGEEVTWPSIVCRSGKCEPMTGRGWLFSKPGQTKVVIVSHGSVGIDGRVFDRVDQLQAAGFASLAVDHWGPRGLGEILSNLKDAPARGGSELNMAFDIYTAADMLRNERGFDKVGAIGASYGGGAQITAQQKWAMDVIGKTVSFHYKRDFIARKLDAQVSLYGFCGYRNALRDAFNGVPLLILSGERDDIDPPQLCERLAPWMNERGGNVKFSVIPGVAHTWDSRDRETWIPDVVHMGKCDLLVDAKGITDLASGRLTPGDNNTALPKAVALCATARGFHSGSRGDPFVAVPQWIDFFRRNL